MEMENNSDNHRKNLLLFLFFLEFKNCMDGFSWRQVCYCM